MNNVARGCCQEIPWKTDENQEVSSPRQHSTGGTPDIRTIMIEDNFLEVVEVYMALIWKTPSNPQTNKLSRQ
jgi:hypothetical protein